MSYDAVPAIALRDRGRPTEWLARGSVAVLDTVPAYARGIAAALEAQSYEVEAFLRAPAMADLEQDVVVAAIRCDADWRMLSAHVQAREAGRIVAVLPDASVDEFARALREGACSAVSECAPVADIVAVVDAAFENRTLLDVDVARDLARRARHRVPEHVELDGSEVHRLRALAAGRSIAQIAAESCFSEREMYRSLSRLYARMGAENRLAAIALSVKWGVVR